MSAPSENDFLSIAHNLLSFQAVLRDVAQRSPSIKVHFEETIANHPYEVRLEGNRSNICTCYSCRGQDFLDLCSM